MTFWKDAGLTYLQYLDIAARAAHRGVKPELRKYMQKHEEITMKYARWENGKQGENKSIRK